MKKFYLILIMLSVIISNGFAQTPYGSFTNYFFTNGTAKKDTSNIIKADSLYVGIYCRNGAKQALYAKAPGTLTVLTIAQTVYNAGDSLTWKIVQGASVGTTPRVRFVNLKTGEYLKSGTINGVLTPYVAPFYDNVSDGLMDFYIKHQNDGGIHYFIVGNGNSQFFNATAGVLTASSPTSTSSQGWALVAKKGPQPKIKMPEPTVSLSTVETSYYAGGTVTLNVKVNKIDNQLKGKTLLYLGTTLLDTLQIDANGEATKIYENLSFGKNIFTVVYTGDDYYSAINKSETINAVAALTAKPTNLSLQIQPTAELHKNPALNISVKTTDGDVVSGGDVLVYINGIAKNRVTVDFMGTGILSMPSLLTGTTNFKAIYLGNKIEYLDSDTARTSIQITPSTSSVIPYPVYFDLSSQHEIVNWEMKNQYLSGVLGHKYTRAFRTDSLPGMTVTDTINNTHKIRNVAAGTTYSKITDAYNHADYVTVPLGSSRPTSVKIKTPWLNEGNYNVYISDRKTSEVKITITNVTLDNNELYYPNEEMYGRWFRSTATSNSNRRWNAKATGGTGMNYLGTANAATSGVHELKISVASENGTDVFMDMLQFIPVDQDSMSVNLTAAQNSAKLYYPMFSWLGFTYQSGYDPATVAATYADNSNLALTYQVNDKTDWGQKYNYKINGFTTDTIMIGADIIYANYVTVYKAEDKWTRVAQGYATGDMFEGQLPKGDYYYETIMFTDMSDGAYDYRTLVKTGTFSLPITGTPILNNSKIKAYAANRILNVRGIDAGAQIYVSDIAGRTIINTISKSDIFTASLPQGIYIVKVVSGETLRTKVLVK